MKYSDLHWATKGLINKRREAIAISSNGDVALLFRLYLHGRNDIYLCNAYKGIILTKKLIYRNNPFAAPGTCFSDIVMKTVLEIDQANTKMMCDILDRLETLDTHSGYTPFSF